MAEIERQWSAFTGLTGNNTPDLPRLNQELRESALPGFQGIFQLQEGSATFIFTNPLAGAAVLVLDALIAAHTGDPLPEEPELPFEGQDITNVGTVDGVDISAQASATNAHIADTANPHATDLGNLGTGTLAELNALVTNATLDAVGSTRPPSGHAARHYTAGDDPLIAQSLSSASAPSGRLLQTDGSGGFGLIPTPAVITDHGALGGLGDDDHSQYLRTDGARALTGNLNAGANDIINVGTVDGVDISALASTANAHIGNTANPHGTDLGNLGTGTLAELNALVTNATLDSSSSPRTPTPHAASHGAEGSDELLAQDLGSGGAPAGQVLLTDGIGGFSLSALAGVEQFPVFSGYNTVNSATLPSSFAVIPLGGENTKDTARFTHAVNSAEVTVLVTGLYYVEGFATLNMLGNSRNQSEFRVTRSTGGVFNLVPGMSGLVYHRQSAASATQVSVSQVLTLQAGDRIRTEGRTDNANQNVVARANSCGLVIISLDGIRGPQGPPGTGASLLIQEDNAAPSGNLSYTTLDFDGDNFSVSDEGSGRARVERRPLSDVLVRTETIVNTTSTSYIVLQTATVPKDGTYAIQWSGTVTADEQTTLRVQIWINGVVQSGTQRQFTQTQFVSSVQTLATQHWAPGLSAGDVVDVRWNVNTGTGQAADRNLLLLER